LISAILNIHRHQKLYPHGKSDKVAFCTVFPSLLTF